MGFVIVVRSWVWLTKNRYQIEARPQEHFLPLGRTGRTRLRSASSLFFNLFAGFFPFSKTGREIDEMLKPEFAHLLAGARTADARSAVDQVNLLFVQRRNPLEELRRVHVQVDCAR